MSKRQKTGTMQRRSSPVLRLRGVAVLVAAAAALVALTALVVPGKAQAAAGPDAQYYRSSFTTIEPATTGVDLMLHDNEGSVMLTNATGTHTVTVVGYSGEDYLKITPTRVYENTNSLTAALNKDGGAPPPRLTSGKKLPVTWRQTAVANSVMWRDVRVHWSGAQRPPIVQDDPYSPHVVNEWGLPLKVDDQPVLARGRVSWTGMPQPERTHYPIAVAIGVVALLLVVAATVLTARRRRLRHEHDRSGRETEYATSRFIGARN